MSGKVRDNGKQKRGNAEQDVAVKPRYRKQYKVYFTRLVEKSFGQEYCRECGVTILPRRVERGDKREPIEREKKRARKGEKEKRRERERERETKRERM